MIKRFALIVLTALLTGCGLSPGSSVPISARPGSIQPVPELRGVPISVGSKEFTEQVILGYIAEIALRAAGANVRDMANIQGSNSARAALESQQIDMMWDYTGTAWISYFGRNDPIPEARAQYEAVRGVDRDQHGIEWTALAPLDNTYALAVRTDTARRLGLSTLSDLARVVRERPDEAKFCVESEFASRNDGFPGVQKAYGFAAPPENITNLAAGAIYRATADGTCTVGEVYTTDGRIRAQDLKVLSDDRQFFPRYNGAVAIRRDLLGRYPQVGEVMNQVAPRLTSEVMRRLNAKVDVEGQDPAEVAKSWMIEQGFVS